MPRSITGTHEDLDCILINSGIQRGLDFSKPESVDLNEVQIEYTTNYLSYLALTKAFMPFLQNKDTESALMLYVHWMSRERSPEANKNIAHHQLWHWHRFLAVEITVRARPPYITGYCVCANS